eukprot:3589804-Amphidinium_carterae.1
MAVGFVRSWLLLPCARGLVERETITQIQDLFASLDMDRDGSVSRGEIRDRFEVQRDEEAHDQSWHGAQYVAIQFRLG